MRRFLIAMLLVSQTLVLAAIVALGLGIGDRALDGTPFQPRSVVASAGSSIGRFVMNESRRIAFHAGFVRNEVRRVAWHAARVPTLVASRARALAGD